jgi:hypothetical protein
LGKSAQAIEEKGDGIRSRVKRGKERERAKGNGMEFGDGIRTPLYFVSADSEGVRERKLVSADSKVDKVALESADTQG